HLGRGSEYHRHRQRARTATWDRREHSGRVSSREAYVSPTRGAQGNALKTILAMAFALDGESGETLIEAQGVAHRVTFSIDRIRREPKITHVREASPVKIGTRIKSSIVVPGSRTW